MSGQSWPLPAFYRSCRGSAGQRVCHNEIAQEIPVVEVDEQVGDGPLSWRQPMLLSVGLSDAVADDVVQQQLDAVVALPLGEGSVADA
jgi:hypothetical protein